MDAPPLMVAKDATAAAITNALQNVFPRGWYGTIKVTIEDGKVRRDTICLELRVK